MKIPPFFKRFILLCGILIVVGMVVFLISTDGMATFGAFPNQQHIQKLLLTSKYHNGKFQNLTGGEVNRSVFGFMKIFAKFMFSRVGRGEPGKPLPIVDVDATKLRSYSQDQVRITWLGHASLLIELEGYRILTDPVFSERASPISWMGPKRFHPVPIEIEQIPPLDAIVISHDHYDHLDYQTIRKLAPRTTKFFVPLGVAAHLISWGIDTSKIVERDWWQEAKMNDRITLIATPAQHFSGRSLLARNSTLWASWVIVGRSTRIYFSGDTGMFNAFKEIGARYGPFDYTLMHVGAYAKEWPKMHMTPEEAVQAHRDLRGNIFVPIHWGSFRLAFHDWDEPAERLYQEAQNKNIGFVIPIAGQFISNLNVPAVDLWWRIAG